MLLRNFINYRIENSYYRAIFKATRSGTNDNLIYLFKYLSQFISLKYSCDLTLLKLFSPLPNLLLGSKFNKSFIKLIAIGFKSG